MYVRKIMDGPHKPVISGQLVGREYTNLYTACSISSTSHVHMYMYMVSTCSPLMFLSGIVSASTLSPLIRGREVSVESEPRLKTNGIHTIWMSEQCVNI